MTAEPTAAPAEEGGRRRRGRPRRPTRVALYAVPVLVVLIGIPLYVLPAQDEPAHVDVVYVLGSPDVWRVRLAEQLLHDGRADRILISVPSRKRPPSTCTADQPDVVCGRPDPGTTEGEARLLRSEMRTHGWRTVLAITSTPHVTRARLILRQCVPTGVGVMGRPNGVDLGEWLRQYAYQSAALVKALVAPAC